MNIAKEVITSDLYQHDGRVQENIAENKITYEQIYWMLFTGFGTLIASILLLMSHFD